MFESKTNAVDKWEQKHSVTFVPGSNMAEYDSGSEGVLP